MADNPSSLFQLISLAGSASLGELRARSSADPMSLAQDLTNLLRDGLVEIIASGSEVQEGVVTQGAMTPQHQNIYERTSHDLSQVMHWIQEASGSGALNEKVRANEDTFKDAFYAAIRDEDVATSISVSPTPKGFRRGL